MKTPKRKMSASEYARKTAFHIDPLLHETVEIKGNPRYDTEIDGGELWKQRDHDKDGRTIWTPLLFLLVLAYLFIVTNPSETTFAENRPVDIGLTDNNFHVKQVQYVLRSFGYSIVVDGAFGPQTERAVRHFQKVNGLEVDGIVGPKTLKAMGLILGEPATASAPAVRINPPKASSSQDGWHDLAISVGWEEAQWPIVSCIINRESKGQSGVVNSIGATGLMQILQRYYPGINLRDPETNLRIGHELYLSQGWQPWTLPGHQCY